MKQKIAFITDTHLNQSLVLSNKFDTDKMSYKNIDGAHLQHFEKILNDIKERNISDIIFGGDIGTINVNKQFFEIIKEQNWGFCLILGNHDKFLEVKKYYHQQSEAKETLDYTKEDEFFKYIFLDSSANILQDTQLVWLSEELKTSKKIVVFIHHPILQIPTQLHKIGGALRNREIVENILKSISNDVFLFCGHYHMTDETTENNIHQYCTIASSYEIKKDSGTKIVVDEDRFGYRIIEIEDSLIKTNTIILK